MTRTFIDLQRSKKRVRVVSLDAPAFQSEGDDGGAGFEIEDCTTDPSSMVERQVFAEPLQRALGKLSPDFRIVLILADVEELSYEEVAGILDCPVGTVRSRLHRSRMQMKKELESAGYFGPR
jgi:RNA polymerase sigma-70 factor (ECF subfamily)